MPDKRGNSQSAGQGQLLAHKSSPKDGHAFKLQAPYKPTGDQPQAIAELVKGFKEGNQFQTLLGGYGFWQDVYDGECHSGIAEAHAGHRPQQDACGSALRRIQGDVP